MASKMYFRQALTGGGASALDGIDGAVLADQDAAFVITDEWSYIYHLDADSDQAESSPQIIAPDINAGNKRWVLMKQVEYISTLDQRRVFVQPDQPGDAESDIGDLWIDIS